MCRWILYKAHNPTLGASACWLNSHCTNSVGSFDCSCDTGWTIDIVQLDNCIDIDEDRLKSFSDVHDIIFEYFAWYLNNEKCFERTHICHINAACSNTDGSYTCACAPGFKNILPATVTTGGKV